MVEENVSGNSKKTKVQFDDSVNQIHYSLPKTPSSSSASLSNSSLESTLTDKDTYPSPQFEIQSSPNNIHHGQTSSTLMDSPSQYSSTHARGRSAGYDPNRIPASVFCKPTSPLDWSVASNESLFSIHMGNNSFSRDHNFLLYKSGELTKLDEVFSVPTGLTTVDESLSTPRASNCSAFELLGSEACDLVKTMGEETSENASRKSNVTATSIMEINELGLHTTEEEDHGKENIASPVVDHARTSTSLSTHSDGSVNSSTSFAFPVLAAQETKVMSRRIPTIKEDVTKEQPILSQPNSSQHPLPQRSLKHAKASVTHLFSCFSCCSCRCSLPLK